MGMFGIPRRLLDEEHCIFPEAVPTQHFEEVGSTSVTGAYLAKYMPLVLVVGKDSVAESNISGRGISIISRRS